MKFEHQLWKTFIVVTQLPQLPHRLSFRIGFGYRSNESQKTSQTSYTTESSRVLIQIALCPSRWILAGNHLHIVDAKVLVRVLRSVSVVFKVSVRELVERLEKIQNWASVFWQIPIMIRVVGVEHEDPIEKHV